MCKDGLGTPCVCVSLSVCYCLFVCDMATQLPRWSDASGAGGLIQARAARVELSCRN